MTPYEKLDALYATLPKIACKKLCGFSNCGPIQASKIETKRIEERTGLVNITPEKLWQSPEFYEFRDLPYHLGKQEFYKTMVFFQPTKNLDCQFLMPVIGTCRVYVLRPLICHLWGLVNHPAMRCAHGCVPERWVTPEEGRKYFQEVARIQEEENENQRS